MNDFLKYVFGVYCSLYPSRCETSTGPPTLAVTTTSSSSISSTSPYTYSSPTRTSLPSTTSHTTKTEELIGSIIPSNSSSSSSKTNIITPTSEVSKSNTTTSISTSTATNSSTSTPSPATTSTSNTTPSTSSLNSTSTATPTNSTIIDTPTSNSTAITTPTNSTSPTSTAISTSKNSTTPTSTPTSNSTSIILPTGNTNSTTTPTNSTSVQPTPSEGIEYSVCTKPVLRKEIRQLSPVELKRFISAIHQLHSKPSKSDESKYDKYTKIHIEYHRYAHGGPAFLPWHRYFIRKFELELQEIDKSIVLPYWDWTIDSQEPELSPILQERIFGGNGDPKKDQCLTNGPFKNFTMRYPEPHCLRRDYADKTKIPAFTSIDVMKGFLSDIKEYKDWELNLEVLHGPLHLDIGGEKGDLMPMHSPNDPLFFLHHTFVDMLWYNWQMLHPSSDQYKGDKAGVNVTHNDIMPPFNTKVQPMLDTRDPSLCYYYQPYQPRIGSLKAKTGFDFSDLKSKNLFSNATKEQAKIDPLDRESKQVIRTIPKLPLSWIQMNGLDPAKVSKIQNDTNAVAINLNAIPGYTPVAKI